MATSVLQNYLVPGLAGLAGFLNSGKTTGTGTTNTTGVSNTVGTTGTKGTSTTTPTYDPTTQAYRDALIKQYMDGLTNAPNLNGYEASGIKQINTAAELSKESAAGNLASNGVYGPAAAAGQQGIDDQRFANITNFRSGIPLLQQDYKNQALQNAGAFFNSLPTGTTNTVDNTQTTNNTTNTNQSGNQTESQQGPLGRAGNAGTDAASTLAYIYGNGGSGGNGVDKEIAGHVAKSLGLAGAIGSFGTAGTAAGAGAAGGATTSIIGTTSGTTGTGLLGGLQSVASFMSSNPITIPIAAAIGAFIAYKEIGKGRKQANNFNEDVHNHFFKNDGTGTVNQLVDGFNKAYSSGQLTKQQAVQSRDALQAMLNDYLDEADKFSQKGNQQAKVVSQDLAQLRNNFGPNGVQRLVDDMNQKIAGLAA